MQSNFFLLSDKFSYTDNGKEEGLFIASFIEEPDIQKQKVVSLAEEKVRYRVANYNIKELCIDNYIELIQKKFISDNRFECNRSSRNCI